MRTFLLGSIGALALATAADGQVGPSPEALAWVNSLPSSGWKIDSISTDDQTATFFKAPFHSSGGAVAMWVRFENRVPNKFGDRSVVELIEFDCGQRRTRTLQSTSYIENNQSGPSDTDSKPHDWQFAIPGSIIEGLTDRACREAQVLVPRQRTATRRKR